MMTESIVAPLEKQLSVIICTQSPRLDHLSRALEAPRFWLGVNDCSGSINVRCSPQCQRLAPLFVSKTQLPSCELAREQYRR
jgi:hypothetical protein